jgi:hypothetical protein
MKKAYVKPTISFESFKMSSSIAANCARNKDEIIIPDNIGGYNIFIDDCEYTPADGEFGICYDVPTEDIRVFAS